MKIAFYFQHEPITSETGGRSASRYRYIQTVLTGFTATCTQRIFTTLSEFILQNFRSEAKKRLILPLRRYGIRPLERKLLMDCNTLYVIYFSNLTILQVHKLDSYLLTNEKYLGCSEVHHAARSIVDFDLKYPSVNIENKRISIMVDSYERLEFTRDTIFEDIVKGLCVESWNYTENIRKEQLFFASRINRRRFR